MRATVANATKTVARAQVNVATAKSSIAEAQRYVAELAPIVAPDLRPQLAALEFRLGMAQNELDEANKRHAEALQDLAQAEARAGTLQGEINQQADALRTVAGELEKVTGERNDAIVARDRADADASKQRGLAWKWRISFVALALAIVAWLFRKPLGRLVGIPIP